MTSTGWPRHPVELDTRFAPPKDCNMDVHLQGFFLIQGISCPEEAVNIDFSQHIPLYTPKLPLKIQMDLIENT